MQIDIYTIVAVITAFGIGHFLSIGTEKKIEKFLSALMKKLKDEE